MKFKDTIDPIFQGTRTQIAEATRMLQALDISVGNYFSDRPPTELFVGFDDEGHLLVSNPGQTLYFGKLESLSGSHYVEYRGNEVAMIRQGGSSHPEIRLAGDVEERTADHFRKRYLCDELGPNNLRPGERSFVCDGVPLHEADAFKKQLEDLPGSFSIHCCDRDSPPRKARIGPHPSSGATLIQPLEGSLIFGGLEQFGGNYEISFYIPERKVSLLKVPCGPSFNFMTEALEKNSN